MDPAHWTCDPATGLCSWTIPGSMLSLVTVGLFILGMVLGLITVRLVMG
jgi:hypothetical protein